MVRRLGREEAGLESGHGIELRLGGHLRPLFVCEHGVDGLAGVHDLAVQGTRVRCEVDHAALNDVLARLTQAGVRSLTCRPPTLEELFLRHYSSERPLAGAQE